MATWSELEKASYISLATRRKSGVWVATPIWAAADEHNTLYAFSEKAAGKIKRLKNSDAARLAVCDVRGKLLGEWIEASAQIIRPGDEDLRALPALHKKYGWQIKITDFFSKLTGKYNKRAYLEITPPRS